jgi:predicted Zn-dependent protease
VLLATCAILALQSFLLTSLSAQDRDHTCPSSPEINSTLAKASAFLQQSNFSQAADLLQSSAALPCEPHVDLLLAAAYEGLGDATRAADTMDQAHAQWPSDQIIAVSLARYELAAGDVARAAAALQHFEAASNMPWQEIQMAVMVFITSHQLPAAEKAAQAGYKSYHSLASLLLLANTMQLEGRYKDVIALLSAQRSSYMRSPTFLVTLAQSEYDAAMYDEARKDVEHGIALDPNIYAAHYLLGNLFLKTGDPDAAAAQYRIALQLEPTQPRTYYYLALTLRAQHNEAGEESLLNQAITLDKGYALAHCEMGRIYLNQNRLTDAVAQLKLALDDNASSEQAYYLLARAYDRLGDKANAEEMTKQLTLARKSKHAPTAEINQTP